MSYVITRTSEIERRILNLSSDKWANPADKLAALQEIDTFLHYRIQENGGTAGGGSLQPDDVPGLLNRWKSTSLSLAEGAQVQHWPSLAGNQDLIGAAESGKRNQRDNRREAKTDTNPIFRANAINGHPAVETNGSSSYLWNAVDLNTPQPNTAFVVAKQTESGGSGDGAIFYSGGNTNPQNSNAQLKTAGLLMRTGNPSAGGNLDITAPGNYTNAWHVFAFVFNGANSKAYVDGTEVASGNLGTASAFNWLYLGSGNINYLAALYAEQFHYGVALSAALIQSITQGLKTEYGL